MSPNSLNPRDRRAYRRRARPFIFVGYLFFAAAASAILQPAAASQTTVAHLLSPAAELTWQFGYAAGGILMVIGAVTARPSVEITGLWLALYGLAVNSVALIAVRGVAGSGLALAAYLLTAWVVHGRIADLHAAATIDRRSGPRRGASHRVTR